MAKITLEEKLQEIHAEQYQGFDDDMPEDFDRWLEDLTIEDIYLFIEDMK